MITEQRVGCMNAAYMQRFRTVHRRFCCNVLIAFTTCLFLYRYIIGPLHLPCVFNKEKSLKIAPAYNTCFLEGYVPDPNRYLIDTCSEKDQCEGWGDRQRAVVTTYLISLITNRTYGILMDKPCDVTKVIIPNKINWVISKDRLVHLKSRHFYMQNDHVKKFQLHKMIETADIDKQFLEPVIYFHTHQDYVMAIRRNVNTADKIPWLHKLSLSKVYGNVLRHLFSPTIETQRVHTKFMLNDVRGRTLVCAHVRMGVKGIDSPRTQNKEVGTIWTFLDSYKNSSRYALYVATDRNETKAEAKKRFEDSLVDTEGPIQHIRSDATCSGFQKVIIEQMILTKCNILLLTRSSFGIIAAYMRDTNEGLYCLFKNRIFPCSMEILHELHNSVL